MTEFRTNTDVANRALQHCGARRIDATLGFSESSVEASEIGACFGKLREAELQTNVWTFAVRYAALRAIDSNTMLLNPAVWVETTTYFRGSIVSDENGSLWISKVPSNLGNDPENSTTWEPYFGPLTVAIYDSAATTSYMAGELVYTTPGDGTARTYLSLQSDNSDVPGTATAYDATVTFFKNQVVTYLSVAYMSLIDFNLNQTPTASPAVFNLATTYAAGNQVCGSDGVIYTSIGSGNVGHDPTTDSGIHWTNTGVLCPWTTVFTGGTGSDKWLQIGGTEFPNGVGLTTLGIVYPLGAGPTAQSLSRNVYRLPAGYLREAPQNPKAVPVSFLGGPSGITYNDWRIDNDFLVTSDVGPIVFRFVANVTDVSRMNSMFCEGLAGRIGLEVCEILTQSTAKLQMIAKIYQEWIAKAKVRNAIEQGYDDPPDDDFVTCRL